MTETRITRLGPQTFVLSDDEGDATVHGALALRLVAHIVGVPPAQLEAHLDAAQAPQGGQEPDE